MKTFVSKLLTVAILIGMASSASAHDYTIGDVAIGHPWTRATLPNQPVGGGYMTFTNNGTSPMTLIGGSSPIAESVEIHKMEMDGDLMRMMPIEGGLTIEPGESVELSPGGIHLMLTGLSEPIEMGTAVPLTLEFSDGRTIEVELAADGMRSMGPSGSKSSGEAHGMSGMKHGSSGSADHGSMDGMSMDGAQ
ncbi:copper chaperone PCu(A)C [Fulvimarina sp. MAC8]|uniref:copper chaperone PCu(A)C n=1 Tax=Fulvimarina sp. MAC8 TaxID=3162874 RepID=UPI0032F02B37